MKYTSTLTKDELTDVIANAISDAIRKGLLSYHDEIVEMVSDKLTESEDANEGGGK